MSFKRGNWRDKLRALDSHDSGAPPGDRRKAEPTNAFKWRGKTLGRVATLSLDGTEMEVQVDELHDVAKIGAGQFGTVKMVELRKGTVVRNLAIKEIQVRDTDGTSTKTICKELDILSTSINKFIVQYHGCFYYDQSIIIVMEFMHYGSLDKIYMQVGKIPEPIVGRIMFGIITGLNYLYGVWNVIHRDMKPSNVLLNKHGHIKICDFGVSRPESTKPMSHVGCRNYMAPERIEPREGVQYDFKSDIWSVGITMIELLEARYPWEDKRNKYFELLKAITTGPPPRLSPGISEEALEFVHRCLSKDAQTRPDYMTLLDMPFLQPFLEADATTDLQDWIQHAGLRTITITA